MCELAQLVQGQVQKTLSSAAEALAFRQTDPENCAANMTDRKWATVAQAVCAIRTGPIPKIAANDAMCGTDLGGKVMEMEHAAAKLGLRVGRRVEDACDAPRFSPGTWT